MPIDRLLPTRLGSPPGTVPSDARTPRSPEEAARQFEALFVRQIVDVMTASLFKSPAAEGGAASDAYADLGRDTLAGVLADRLTEGGRLGLADRLLRQWQRDGRLPGADASSSTPSTSHQP